MPRHAPRWTGHRRAAATVTVAMALAVTGCSLVQPAAGVVWFCQGVDASHPAGSRVTVTIERGAQTLASIGIAVPGGAGAAIVPGDFVVKVDGKQATTGTVAGGGTSSAQVGADCPAEQ